MKTLQEIKDEVALNNGYWSYKLAVLAFKDGNMKTELFNAMVNEIGREVAKEALKNASENASTTQVHNSDGVFDVYKTVVDKQSILNESNIPNI